jgi:hypothetical protein
VDGGPMTQVGVGDRERHMQWHERLASALPSPDQ